MLSTDLPVTEWWDPEWDQYDVPSYPEDSLPFELWHACYMHQAWLEWLMTGRTWGWPDGLLARQLEPARRPPSWYPGQPDPPRVRVDRCCCLYIRHYLLGTPPPGVEIVVNPVIATAFLIDEQCTHHGLPALEHDEYP